MARKKPESSTSAQPTNKYHGKMTVILGMTPAALLRLVSIVYFCALVVAAVAGAISIVAGIAQYKLSNFISDQKDRDLAEYQSKASVKISAADAQAQQAKKAAAEANERAATLEVEAAQLKLDLTEKTAPLVERRLSTEEALRIENSLRGRNLRVNVFAFGANSDPEIGQYAQDIISVLSKAGVLGGKNFSGSVSVGGISQATYGLQITGPNGPGKTRLMKAFREAGVSFGEQATPILDNQAITIAIGPRSNLFPSL